MTLSAADAARKRFAEAADALAKFRDVAGVPAAPEAPSSAWRAPAGASVRAALEASETRVRELEASLTAMSLAHDALEEENRRFAEAAARHCADAPEAEALRQRVADAEARAAEQKSRAALMEAEYVRLESLRRKAERAAADAEASGRVVEETVRRELRVAHAALDRAAAESGAQEGRAKAENEALRQRLESASARLQELDREKRLERARGSGDVLAVQTELQRAQAVAAALRQELATSEQREEALRRELTASRRASAPPNPEGARRENPPLAASVALPEPPVPAALPDEFPAPPLSEPGEPGPLPDFISPSVEAVLDPGWARLLRLIRPPVEAAYAQMRRLSATALTAGQKALLRMAAASVAEASDSLTSVELALEEGPAPMAPAPALPTIEASLAAWETAFRRRGVALVREWSRPLPDAAFDAKALRVMVYHVLRNVLEASPRGGRLAVRASRGADGGLCVEFVDDGPGFPAEWMERRFEPFAAPRRGRAGLGLSLVRRTLRRWGGDAAASNGPSGRGARLTMTFAPPAPPQPE